MLDLLFVVLFLFGLDDFGGGTGTGGAGRIVVAPPPCVRGGGEEHAETQGYGESEKGSLHRIHL